MRALFPRSTAPQYPRSLNEGLRHPPRIASTWLEILKSFCERAHGRPTRTSSRRLDQTLEDEFRSAWDRRSGHIQSSGLAAAAIGRLRIDTAGTVDQDVFCHHHHANRSVARFVNGPTHGDVGIW